MQYESFLYLSLRKFMMTLINYLNPFTLYDETRASDPLGTVALITVASLLLIGYCTRIKNDIHKGGFVIYKIEDTVKPRAVVATLIECPNREPDRSRGDEALYEITYKDNFTIQEVRKWVSRNELEPIEYR